MMDIPGYTLDEMLYESRRSRIFRGRRDEDARPVVLKIRIETSAAHPLRHEMLIGRLFDHQTITRYLALEDHHGQEVLVEEDFGGVGLDQLLPGTGFPLETFLHLALQLAAGLAIIHRQSVLHKDIKPSNLVCNPDTWVVKYIDFCIATRRLQGDSHRSTLDPRHLEGSLRYMSPEQTGRLDRSLDSRTDLYSLGVTFYEMLTGKPPFSTDDPLQLIHAHIARAPTAPHEPRPEVPPALSEIVLKLLQKDAEDRYQTARGLEADLLICRKRFRRQGTIAAFELGRQDRSEVFKVPQKIYGRENETTRLLAAFGRTVDPIHQSEPVPLLLIAGSAGVGKSTLVHQLYEPVTTRRGHFAGGKHEQDQKNIPHLALSQALENVVSDLLTSDRQEIDRWRRQIGQALGSSAQILIDAIPSLGRILGEQEAALSVGPGEARNRFQRLLRRLLAALADAKHPLVLFLDDLQWADASSLDFLVSLMAHRPPSSLLLVGAYRADEVDDDHPLRLAISEIETQGGVVDFLTLHNLPPADIDHMLSDALSSSPAVVSSLSKLVHEKTLGNPFFTAEFLKSLHAGGLLGFDPTSSAWRWNVEQIRALDITDNVVDLLAEKMAAMDAGTRELLEKAACIGRRFNLSTLTTLAEDEPLRRDAPHPKTSILERLRPAIRDGLIQPLAGGPSGRQHFVHDRIHQAALSLLSDTARAEVDVAIARALLAESRTPDEHIFEVADHCNRAAAEMTTEDEIIEVAELNLRAGRKAKQTAAHAAARSYLEAGFERLPDALWDSHHELLFELQRELAEVELVTERFDEVERLCTRLLDRATHSTESLAIRFVLLEQLTIQGRGTEALEVARASLLLLGIDLPADEAEVEDLLRIELAALPKHLGQRSIADLAHSPAMSDPEQKLLMRLLSGLSFAAHVDGRPMLAAWTTVRRVKCSLVYGSHELSATAYAAFAYTVAIQTLGDYAAAPHYASLAAELASRLKEPGARGSAYVTVATTEHWSKPLAVVDERLREAYELCLEGGNLKYGGFAAGTRLHMWFLAGHDLASFEGEMADMVAFIRRLPGPVFEGIARVGALQPAALLRERTRSTASFDDDEFQEERFLATYGRIPLYRAIFLIAKLEVLYFFGHIDDGLALAEELQKIDREIRSLVSLSHAWLFLALTLIADIDRGNAGEGYQELLDELEGQLQAAAARCPQNHRHKALLVAAERARQNGDPLAAMEAYSGAVTAAADQGFIHHEGLANELYGRFWLTRKEPIGAHGYLRRARQLYTLWGATAKVRHLDANHPRLEKERATPSVISSGADSGSFDVGTVLKASRAISGEIRLDQLLERLMLLVAESAGAQQGLLFLERDGELFAAVDIDDSGTVTVRSGEELTASVEPERVTASPAVLGHVRSHGERLVLDDALQDQRFASSPHVVRHQVRSVLCAPVSIKGSTSGILYLENNLVTGAFTRARMEMLQMLLAQAAVSLENAVLVEELTRQRRLLNQRLAAGRERERSEVAHRIHEEPKQLAVGARHQIEVLESGLGRGMDELQLRTHLQQMDKNLGTLIDALGSIAVELGKPKKLEESGLAIAISDHLQNLESVRPIPDVTLELEGDEDELSSQQILALYRISQKGINNSVQHAQATRLIVRSHNTGVAFHLEIEDDGIGFSPPSNWLSLAGNHYGILSAMDTAKSANGVLTIHSKLGAGTRVRVQISLRSTWRTELATALQL